MTCGNREVKDLPVGHRPVQVIWRKPRYRCPAGECPQRVFTERSEQIPPRHRLTGRLRTGLEQAASRAGRALSDVAAEYRVSWWSAHSSLVVAAAARTPRSCRRYAAWAWMRPGPGRCVSPAQPPVDLHGGQHQRSQVDAARRPASGEPGVEEQWHSH